jgi:hypothetical protein
MGFSRWDHTGSEILYNGADRKERNKPAQAAGSTLVSLRVIAWTIKASMDLTTEYVRLQREASKTADRPTNVVALVRRTEVQPGTGML